MAHCGGHIVERVTMEATNNCATFNDSLLHDSFQREQFSFDEVFALVQLVLSCYLFTIISVYEVQNRNRGDSARVNYFSFASVTLNFIFSIRVSVELLGPLLSTAGCQALDRFGVVCYVVGSGLLYTILWARQHALYADPLLKQSVNRSSRICSYSLIFAIYGALGVVGIVLTDSFCLVSTKIGCLITWDQNKTVSIIPSFGISFMTACFVFQISLLFLMIQSLVSVKKRGCCCLIDCKSQEEVHKMVRRLTICTGICVSTSLTMSMLILFDATTVSCIYWTNWVGLDLLLSNVAVILTFGDWKKRMFPTFLCDCVACMINNSADSHQSTSVAVRSTRDQTHATTSESDAQV